MENLERRNFRSLARFRLTLLLLIAVALGACGAAKQSNLKLRSGTVIAANPTHQTVKLTLGNGESSEERLLAQIYAQALKAAGFSARTRPSPGAPTAAAAALRSGQVSGFPAFLSGVRSRLLGTPLRRISREAGRSYRRAKGGLEKIGLTAFPPTPFTRALVLATLRTKNREEGWGNLFGMEGTADEQVVAGPAGCKDRFDCLEGLRRNYAMVFKDYKVIPSSRRYAVLESGAADLSVTYTTDPRLWTERDKFMALVDVKKVLPPWNAIFVTTPAVVREAGPDFRRTIVAVQKGLTVPVMHELNARVELDGETPAQAAREYLEEAGYVEG